MKLLYFHNPHAKESRTRLDDLVQSNDYILEVIHRTSPEHDRGYWISFLPTLLLVDDAGNEIMRIEIPTNMKRENVKWLHDAGQAYKKTGIIPVAPWRQQ